MSICFILICLHQYGILLANTPAMSFSLTGGSIAQGSVVGTNCATDWIIIPCATNTLTTVQSDGMPCRDRICGMVFNSVTTAAATINTSVTVRSK